VNAYHPAVTTARDQRVPEPAAEPAAGSRDFKYTRYDDSPGSTHSMVVGLVPEGSSVLEFGCATGYMTEVLVKQRASRVTGIELDPDAAAQASDHCERVIVGDAETLDLAAELGDERFDAVLFADVLEHLRGPAALLRRVRPFVAEGGVVVASIPNIAHISVRLALLGGEFRYRELGLLDDTHLRFFTRESIVDLFESSGFVVSTWLRRRIELEDAEINPRVAVPNQLDAEVRADPEATTYQFVVSAVPSDAASQLADVRSKLNARTLQELEEAHAELELLRRAHEAQARHLVAERLAFADEVAEVNAVMERLREEIEWRKGVMEEYERRLQRIHASRAYRYSAPIRRLLGADRRGVE
jgi:O-antigen biosynthesis protein